MLLDTSAIIEVLTRKRTSPIFEKIMKAISDEEVYVSFIQIAEIADWCLRNKRPVLDRISFVKGFANVVPLDEEISIEAARIKAEKRKTGRRDFGLIDGIILATARSVRQDLLTFDPHFEGESDCLVLERKRR
jgi:predicted nucleic acid-binding protein